MAREDDTKSSSYPCNRHPVIGNILSALKERTSVYEEAVRPGSHNNQLLLIIIIYNLNSVSFQALIMGSMAGRLLYLNL